MFQPILEAPVALYIRRSRDDQSSYSPEAQERIGRQFCAANDLPEPMLYFDDDYSGTNGERPNFLRMKDDARARRFKTVIAPKMDRFARDVILCLQTYDELRALGVRVWSVAEPLDFDTPMGRKFLTDAASTAEWYSRNLSTEVKKGLYEKAERGGWIGLPPYGYMSIHQFDHKGERVRGTHRLVPSGDAPAVRLIFAEYSTGNHSDSTLRDWLHEEGYTLLHPKTGLRVPFQRDSIGGILRNPAYIGMVRCGGQPYQGAHEPLIDRDLWDHCQAIRERRTRQRGGRVPVRGKGGLLSELAFCGLCGARLRWWASGEGASRQGYYRCARHVAYGREACAAPMIQAARIDPQVLGVVRELAIPARLRDQVLFEVQHRLKAPAAPPSVDQGRMRRQLERLKADWRAGDPDLDEASYRRERARLEALLSEEAPAESAAHLDVGKALRLLCDMPALLDAATIPQRRALLQQLFVTVWLEKEGVTAVQPSPLFMPLFVAAHHLQATSTGLEPARRRCTQLWTGFAVPAGL